jgi:hypothetical protein
MYTLIPPLQGLTSLLFLVVEITVDIEYASILGKSLDGSSSYDLLTLIEHLHTSTPYIEYSQCWPGTATANGASNPRICLSYVVDDAYSFVCYTHTLFMKYLCST